MSSYSPGLKNMVEDEDLDDRILDDFYSMEKKIGKITDEITRERGLEAYNKLKELWLQK